MRVDIWLVAAFLAAVAFAPAALAHDTNHRHQPAAIADAPAATGDAAYDAAADAEPAEAQTRADHDCPDGDTHQHGKHPGCCAGISHCAAGCGAALIATGAALAAPRPYGAAASDSLFASGLVSDPTEPPPRSIL